MTGQRNGKRRRSGRRDLKAMRELISSALVQVIARRAPSRRAAALWFGLDAATVKNWANLKSKVSLEDVLTSETLGESFLACVALKLRKYDRKQREAR
jgi:hypothetical protein